MSLIDRLFAGEHFVLDARVRDALPGKTAWLSDGVTYYELGGPEPGIPVIMIHGFSVPNFIWDPTFDGLTKVGFRVLRYDLFGRGYSDRPRVRYDKALFVRQLADLVDAIGFQRADLVSLSMGGSIAAEFAFRFPKRVRKLAFIDPAGFDLELPFSVKLLRVPVLGEILLGVLGRFGVGSLLDSMLSDFYYPTQESLDYFVPRYLEQMKYHGFKRAILSTLRAGMLDEDLIPYRRLGEAEKEILLVWGKEDRTIPFRHSETFRRLVPQTRLLAIDEARHLPHFEKPKAVNSILIDFLSRSI
ncbi:MAG: alpha/beta hydrolase [Anaerolineales bacterium]